MSIRPSDLVCPTQGFFPWVSADFVPFLIQEANPRAGISRPKVVSVEAMDHSKDLEEVVSPMEKDLARKVYPLPCSEQGALFSPHLRWQVSPKARVASTQLQARMAPTELNPFLSVRSKIQWWIQHQAPQQVLSWIQQGVAANWPCPELNIIPHKRSSFQDQLAKEILAEYLDIGAVQKVSPTTSKFLVPWFVLEKKEKEGKRKLRLITDCRQLNYFLGTKHFKLDHWQHIFPVLRKNMFATKIDLKNAYFHLELHQNIKPYMHIKVGEDIFQFNAACFGLNILPQHWMEVMKVFQKLWRSKGILVFIYLDDILIVSQTYKLTLHHTKIVLEDLEAAGMQINLKKSHLEPVQKIDHLGFHINFLEGRLEVPSEKLTSIRRELGKLITHSHLTPRKMAAILGIVRGFLTALPFLRAFTDQMVSFTSLAKSQGWDTPQQIPPDLKIQIKDIKDLLLTWQGRKMEGKIPIRTLHSDASNHGWAGVDLETGAKIQEFWRGQDGLHINTKELHAAISTIRSLAKPGEKVHLSVDNTVAWSYLRRGGGRKSYLNAMLRPFLNWVQEKGITLEISQIPSAEMQADSLSRIKMDTGDYTLSRNIFLQVQKTFVPWLHPQIDMFASPGNFQLAKFVSRYPHYQSWDCNALEMDLSKVTECYANPPWKIILPWLERLRKNRHIKCLTIVPYWVGAVWWPLLLKLWVPHTPTILVQPHWGLFTNCQGQKMPPTRWPLLCVMLSGSCWRGNKYHLKISNYI